MPEALQPTHGQGVYNFDKKNAQPFGENFRKPHGVKIFDSQ